MARQKKNIPGDFPHTAKRRRRVVINDRLMILLNLLEQGPKYPRQIVLIAPNLVTDAKIRPGERGFDMTGIYTLIKRAKGLSLIEEVAVKVDPKDYFQGQRRYYGLTGFGRQKLQETREQMKSLLSKLEGK